MSCEVQKISGVMTLLFLQGAFPAESHFLNIMVLYISVFAKNGQKKPWKILTHTHWEKYL